MTHGPTGITGGSGNRADEARPLSSSLGGRLKRRTGRICGYNSTGQNPCGMTVMPRSSKAAGFQTQPDFSLTGRGGTMPSPEMSLTYGMPETGGKQTLYKDGCQELWILSGHLARIIRGIAQ